MIRSLLACLMMLALAACAGMPSGGPPLESIRFAPVTLPKGVARSNRELAQDFLDLTFQLENGEQLQHLLRYEEPVRVYMGSTSLAPYQPDLAALLNRLRVEAGVDISQTDDASAAQIHIEAVPSAQIAKVFPTAACFIVPGERDWHGFRSGPGEIHPRWSAQTTLGAAAIFLPPDSTPQDIRDCLNEELTQALGPAMDLYRLPDSIWNDDNFHGMATRFDMTILRTLYQPELHSGMTKAEVAARLPKLLARTNPQGRSLPARRRAPESRPWAEAIEAAQAQETTHDERLAAADLATQIAAGMRPVDHRLGVSLLALGRLSLRQDPSYAATNFMEAYELFRTRLGPHDLRTAQAGVHLAALLLGTAQYRDAIAIADLHVPDGIAYQNAILVASLLSIKAEALSQLGRAKQAQAVRLDSLLWARYGFGDSDGSLGREQAELTALIDQQQTASRISGGGR